MTRKIATKSRVDDQPGNLNNNDIEEGGNETEKAPIKYKKLSEDKKIIRLTSIQEAPEHLAHNIHILRGYRTCRTTKLCIQSMFWWSNETINIWSHLLGTFFFVGLIINDLYIQNIEVSYEDTTVALSLTSIVLIALLFSCAYHTFSCKSEEVFNFLLAIDVFGISCTIMAIYISGLYFAFFCYPNYRKYYIITVLVIFLITITLQIPKFNFSSEVKVVVLCGWALSGILPTVHGVLLMGGFQHPMVHQLFPRIIGLYSILALAFLVYHYHIPERFFPGCFDFVGSSHQLWHLLILLAFYYWHGTFLLYVDYRKNFGCVTLS